MSHCYNGIHFRDRPDLDNVRRLDMGVLPMIEAMQRRGLKVDIPYFNSYAKWLDEDMKRIERDIQNFTGVKCNIGSPEQVVELFKEMGLKFPKSVFGGKAFTKMTKSGKREAIDDKVLEKMKRQSPVVVLVQDFRERKKLLGTYCEPITALARGGVLFPRFKVVTVPTGRLAAEKPNVLAIPTRSDLGKKLRQGFVARRRGWVLGTIDLSQIEMRVAAHDSQDENMCKLFREGLDAYWATARYMKRWNDKLWNFLMTTEKALKTGQKVREEDAKKYREYKDRDRFNAKTTTLGVLFWISASGLNEQMVINGVLDSTEDYCQRMIDEWYGVYTGIIPRRMEHVSRAKEYDYVWDWFGRVRYIPEMASLFRNIRGQGERAAANTPIQGTAQGVIKVVMQILWDLIEGMFKGEIHPLLQVHDELLFEGREGAMKEFLGLAGEVIEGAVPGFLVPIKSSWAMGERWSDLDK